MYIQVEFIYTDAKGEGGKVPQGTRTILIYVWIAEKDNYIPITPYWISFINNIHT